MNLLSSQGSRGWICPLPGAASAWGWMEQSRGGGRTGRFHPPFPATWLARPGFHEREFIFGAAPSEQRGAGTLRPRIPLPAPSTFPAGRFWHELPDSIPSLLLPETQPAINSSGCLLINILIRGNILFSLKSINSLCLDFFVRLIFKANQTLLLASGSHTFSAGCSTAEAAPERALLAGQGFSGRKDSGGSEAFGDASPWVRKLLFQIQERAEPVSDGAQHPWQHPAPDHIPSCPTWTFLPRVGRPGELRTHTELTLSF